MKSVCYNEGYGKIYFNIKRPLERCQRVMERGDLPTYSDFFYVLSPQVAATSVRCTFPVLGANNGVLVDVDVGEPPLAEAYFGGRCY